MAELRESAFTAWELTFEEEQEAAILTGTQRKYLQNKLAEIAEEKLYLELDITMPASYIQQEAGLQGQLQILNWLLEVSDSHLELRKLEQLGNNPT